MIIYHGVRDSIILSVASLFILFLVTLEGGCKRPSRECERKFVTFEDLRWRWRGPREGKKEVRLSGFLCLSRAGARSWSRRTAAGFALVLHGRFPQKGSLEMYTYLL